MKLPEITKGDWTIAKDICGDGPVYSKRPATNGRDIHDALIQCEHFTMAAVSGESLEECRANSRAIAAVPQLLAALREMVIANHGLPINPEDETDPVCRAALESARAALIAAGATE